MDLIESILHHDDGSLQGFNWDGSHYPSPSVKELLQEPFPNTTIGLPYWNHTADVVLQLTIIYIRN